MDDSKKLDMLLDAMANIMQKVTSIEMKQNSMEKTLLKIENEHGEKLAALFDGYTQNTEQLERIENEVKKHEEVILRKVL